MNILFLNVGRRCELVKAFKKVLPGFGGGGMVFGSDIDPLAPGLQFVDESVIFSHSSAAGFISELVTFCQSRDIRLVIPTIDPDLICLDLLRDELTKKLPEMKMLLPSSEIISIAGNKKLSNEAFAQFGLLTPESVDLGSDKIEFPVFVKPACGSAGIGAGKITSKEQLVSHCQDLEDPICEKVVEGPEYTVDVFCNSQGKAVLAVPRKRLAIRGGEVSRGVIERNEELEKMSRDFVSHLKCKVPVTLQFRRTEVGFVAMEINARVGGGLPLTIAAGGEWPKWILQMVNGTEPLVEDYVQDGVVISRFDDSVFLKKKLPQKKVPDLKKVKMIIFDMDDTLYPERDFVVKGYEEVSRYVVEKHGLFIEDELRRRFHEGQRGDLFTLVLKSMEASLPEKEIRKMVNIYRTHSPRISPYTDSAVIKELKAAGYKIGLVSDGWESVQKRKWQSLGLSDLFDHVVFTDELGLEFWKPHTKPFELICEQAEVDYNEAVYIADNPLKDFKAPNDLGMHSLRVRRFGGEHSLKEAPSKEYEAEYEINSLMNLLDIFLRASFDSGHAKLMTKNII